MRALDCNEHCKFEKKIYISMTYNYYTIIKYFDYEL